MSKATQYLKFFSLTKIQQQEVTCDQLLKITNKSSNKLS